MQIRVVFFGATAEAVGKREMSISLDSPLSAERAVALVAAEHPRITSHRLLTALNQEYVPGETILKDGDELAIFTAVSGG